ncbi:MAG: hypothetical protein EHM23_15030, partial [Acidobacteria bacterium]
GQSVPVLSNLTLPNGTSYHFTYNDDVISTCPGYPAVTLSTLQLTSMALPTGASVSVAYAPVPGGCDFLSSRVYDLRLAHMVGAVTVDPGAGQPLTTTYTYTYDSLYNVTTTTETRPDGSKRGVVWNTAGSADPFLRNTEYIADTDGVTLMQRVATGWTPTTSGKYVGFTVTGYYDNGTEVSTSRTEQSYDSWGNPTETRFYADYFGWPRTRTTRQFQFSSSPYLVKLVKEETWRSFSRSSSLMESVTSSTSYFYDEFPLTDRGTVTQQAPGYGPGYTARGNVTRVRRYLVSEDRSIDTTSQYDTVGNVVQVTDPLNHSTSTAYTLASHYAYPTAVTNARGYTVQTSYNFYTSLPATVTDANNQTTSFQYDAYNRLSRVDRPDGGWETRSYVDNYFSGPYRTYTVTRKSVSAGTSSEEWNFYDGLGRVLKTQTLGSPGQYDTVDREYAACSCSGKTSRVSMPYRAGNPVYWTQTQYDGLGRIRKVIPPDGSPTSNYTEYRYRVLRAYVPLYDGGPYMSLGPQTRQMVGVFDAKGVGRVQSYDLEGQLVEVREDAAADFSSSYITEYRPRVDSNTFYNGVAHYVRYSLPTIIQGAQTRWQQIDSLGRVTSDQQAESGLTTFTYDDAGRVVTKTDSRGIVTTTYYDEINRPTSVTFSDGTPGITYTYDQGAYGIGRLYSLTNGVATSTYTYNNMGQVTREDKTINGVAFYTTYGYNLAGQVTTARLPNGTILTNNNDIVGRLASLTSDWVDGNHPATLASGFVYNAAQAVAQVDFGNGTRMTRTFNSGLQLKTLQHGTIGSPDSLLDFEYNYQETVANNGRIMGITNYNDRTKDLSFTYDRLYRLATAQTAGSHWGLSWTCDRYGNRLTQSITKGTAPTSSLTYNAANNRVNGWTYDNAGNTLNDGRHIYTWNALNQQTTMDGTAAQYRYDAQGNRVMKITPTKTTYYVFGTGEYSGGVWEKLYVSLNGQKLVEYSNGTTYFFHSDHLGTPRVQTNLAGAVVETWDAYPFGEQWATTGGVGNQHHYTGKERDPESANDYFGARYYSAGSARWLSVDPVAGNQRNPQRLNLYSYSLNDPVNYTDEDGRQPTTYGSFRQQTTYDGDPFDPFRPALISPWIVIVYCDAEGCRDSNLIDWSYYEENQKMNPSGDPPDDSLSTSPCSPKIISAMTKAWMRAKNGIANTEAGFLLVNRGGVVDTVNLGNTNEYGKMSIDLKDYLRPGDQLLALYHTHPNGMSQSPSEGDKQAAEQLGVRVYVISKTALTVYNPANDHDGYVRGGENETAYIPWSKPCGKK